MVLDIKMLQAPVATHVTGDLKHERWTLRGWEADWHIIRESQKHLVLLRSAERLWIGEIFHNFSFLFAPPPTQCTSNKFAPDSQTAALTTSSLRLLF